MDSKQSVLISLAVFAIGIVCVTGFYLAEKKYSQQQSRLDLYQKAAGHAARLESLIDANLVVARGLRAEILTNSVINQNKIEQLVQHYMESGVHVRHVALAPDLVVQYLFPLKSNEKAIGLDYRQNEQQREAVLRAVRAKEIVLAGPVELVQGGQALVARVPVFLNNASKHFWGLISVVINIEDLFEDAGILELSKDYQVALRLVLESDLQGTPVFGEPDVFQNDAIKIDISLPLGRWELAILPKAGWHMPVARAIRIWAVGIVLSLLLSWVVILTIRSRALVKSHFAELHEQANHDHLTGLPNRKQLSRFLKRITFSEQDGGEDNVEPFCLLFIDLDNFKNINDSLGHNIGDGLLISVSERMESSIRTVDFLARLGGDEFVIVLRGMSDPVQAELWTKKLIDDLSEPYSVEGQDLIITISAGLTFYPQDGLDGATLLQHADRAMYAAKDSGKNTLHFFNVSLRQQADKHVEIYHGLVSALEKGQFEVHYQPILDLRSGRFSRCEALLRWSHPEKGWISPVEFIPIAEKTGFIRQLGLWVLEQVCQDMVALQRDNIEVEVSVNRSASEFRREDSLQQWLPIVQQHNLAPQQFTFEITESLLMADENHCLEKILYLKSKGFKVAIDDFGTGFSSINYLRRYPVDIVKIDKSFVANILSSQQDRTLFDVLVQMAKALQLDLVIEGVELEEQLALTQAKECEFAQGFLMAKPMPLKEFRHFMQASPEYPKI